MFIVTYTAFGLELKRYTRMSLKDVQYALRVICPMYHSLIYRPATEQELRLLSNPVIIFVQGTVTNFRRTIPRNPSTRKYRSQIYPKKRDYIRDKNLYFFEDEIKALSYHIPELECLFYVN